MGALIQARRKWTRTVDAAHRPCLAKWWWQPKTKTAIIESAAAIGLAMLPPEQFHPFQLDTFGLGKLIAAAASKGATRCLIGVGGSATNDAGFGLACALGWKFIAHGGRLIENWTELKNLGRIQGPRKRGWFKELLVAVDVQNPLLGKHGSTRVYGPQKGIRPNEFESAEHCLRRLASVYETEFGEDFSKTPGAGAAGGLGFGLIAFVNGKLMPGFELFAQRAGLDSHLNRADLVITGEGRIDDSTLMGKGVGEIAKKCHALKIPCIGLAGMMDSSVRARRSFDQLHALVEIAKIPHAQSRPTFWLERLAAKVSANLCPPNQSVSLLDHA